MCVGSGRTGCRRECLWLECYIETRVTKESWRIRAYNESGRAGDESARCVAAEREALRLLAHFYTHRFPLKMSDRLDSAHIAEDPDEEPDHLMARIVRAGDHSVVLLCTADLDPRRLP